MATVSQYFNSIRNMQVAIARRFGIEPRMIGLESRALAAANIATTAVLIKALTDNGVLTDAQLQAAWQTAQAETWQPEPVNPEPE